MKKYFFLAIFIASAFYAQEALAATTSVLEVVGLVRQDCTGYSNCYTSLNAWQVAYAGISYGTCAKGDLVCANRIAVAQIDGPWTSADTEAVDIDGWETDETHYIKIYTAAAARHSGKWNEGKYRLQGGATAYDDGYNSLRINEKYVRIEGLQIQTANHDKIAAYHRAIRLAATSGAGEVRVSNNILRGGVSSNDYEYGIQSVAASGMTLKIWNNIIYNMTPSGTTGTCIDFDGSAAYLNVNNTIIYNNTLYNCTKTGINRGGGTSVVKNNIVQNNAANYLNYVGAFSETANNISEDNSSPDAAYRNKAAAFADEANNDFHLASSDAGAKGAGLNLSADSSLSFSDDIDGQPRPSAGSGSWDIGADEYVAPPEITPAPSPAPAETPSPVSPAPVVAAPAPVVSPPASITKKLYLGLKDGQVKTLQEFLAKDKALYPEGLVTGYYGKLTTLAVQKFQCKYEIVCSGTAEKTGYGLVGPKTRAKLNELLK